MIADVRAAKTRSDAVMVSLHWGTEKNHEVFVFDPTPDQTRLARSLINAGASAIFGSHSHAVETIERYKGGVIFYSLGNFVFTGTAKRQHRKSVIARITVDRSGRILDTELIPVNIDPGIVRYRPVPLAGRERSQYLARFGKYR
jgi:poly-gamma-glutamate synthesis protein (capsule biosynthesis protein)